MQTLRNHRCQPRLLYPEKHSVTVNGQSKIFHDRTRFKQYPTTNPALHKVLEGKLQQKEVNYTHQNTCNNWFQSSKLQRRGKTYKVTSPTTKTEITGINNHWSLISLNISGLNSPMKRLRLTDKTWKQNPFFYSVWETHHNPKDRDHLRVKG